MSYGAWGDSDIQPAPLTRPCAGCGGAFRHIDELRLCDGCREQHDFEMAEVYASEQRDKADEDRAAARRYYNG
jgi:predicted amidophosphoribosyltransferase